MSELKYELNEDTNCKQLQEKSELIDFKDEKINHNILVDELLGDLLFILRETKAMSTLMICRQIEKIEIENDCAMLSSEKADISDLISLDRHRVELEKFFKTKGLGFKIKDKIVEKSKVDLLRDIIGDKLIIE